MMSLRSILPPHPPGLRIGLFGGSFNPPHAAHRAVTLHAMKRLRLDRVWWLVTPGNPLKDTKHLPPLADRIAAAETIAAHPRIVVTGLEAVIGTQYSRDTLAYLVSKCPGVYFVWIMGADNLRQFHRWRDWRGIASMAPIAIVDRGALNYPALSGPAAQALARARIPETQAASLATLPPPAWVYLHGLKLPLSSTQLRENAVRAGG
jgi:nicotinate-nucleotide adenylyltransferase